ncbi:MAG: cob(I)yrinic acid a,c-diamide adenosyltransferase [Bacteroidota bacterium]
MAFKIYTKTGDGGETSLFGGKRLPKHHIRIEAYGTIDELNAYVGLVRDSFEEVSTKRVLKEIQNRLFTIGAILATDPEKNKTVPDIHATDIQLLEEEIDRMEATLAPLKNFILPGGHPTVSYGHIARCICRRAERNMVQLAATDPLESLLLQYINRLSDYLFVLCRYISKELNVEEVIWTARK